MKVLYALQSHPKSIFLAGPTPRDDVGKPWRPEAIAILERLGFDGEVIVPQSEDWGKHDQYDAQIEWEWEGIHRATTVAFWMPRCLTTMPGFTSNVEFGIMADKSNVVLGYPEGAPKMGYLKALADRYRINIHSSLELLMAEAIMSTHRWDQKIR